MPANQDVNINLVANNAQAKAKLAETEAQVKKLGSAAESNLNLGKNSTLRGLARFREALYRIAIPATIAGSIVAIISKFEQARAAVINFKREGVDAANSLFASFSRIGRQSTGGIADQIRDLGEQQADALQKISDEKNRKLAEIEFRNPVNQRIGEELGIYPSKKDVEDRARLETEAVLRGVNQARKNLQAIELEQNMQLQREIDSERASEGTKAEQIEAERKSRHQERLLQIDKASQHKANAFRKRQLEELDRIEQENFKKRRDRELNNQYENLQRQIQEMREGLFARHSIDSVEQGALSGEQMLEFMNLVIPAIIRRNGGR